MDINDDWPLEIKATLRATTLHGESRVFFLGPFAKRVNFAAQQNRALNLVHAIEFAGFLDRAMPVAVIGGGLSGLTACTALHLIGYETHLFEVEGDVLARQRATRHRVLHPTVNAWPREPDLNPTTELPFFDWCADVCEDVLAGVLEEWKTLCGNELFARGRLHMNTRVKSYDPQRGGVSLETEQPVAAGPFGGVIYATGFEDEHRLGASIWSYWEDDAFEKIRNRDSKAEFVVSGTGDGGLIDALRLCHRDFMRGNLPLQVATMLQGAKLAGDIRDAEARFTPEGGDDVEARLWDVYLRAAEDLPSPVVDLLKSSLVLKRPLVWLVGQDLTPAKRDAAPIHKLLVAFTRLSGALRYLKGEVTVDAAGAYVLKSKDEREPGPEVTPQTVLVRHGAANRLVDLLRRRPKDLEHLRARQQALHDDLVTPYWRTDPLPAGFPAYDRTSLEFQRSRRKRMQNILRIWPYLRFRWDADRLSLETEKPGAWYPRSLFGIETAIEPIYGDSKAL